MSAASEPPESADAWRRVRLRAPHEAGAVFSRPALTAAGDLCRANETAFGDYAQQVSLSGRTLDRLRAEARSEVLAMSRRYTTELTGNSALAPAATHGPLILTGHQPAWFHPGVWAKNFAAAAAARSLGGTALNLIVDHDTRSSVSVWVPGGMRQAPTRVPVLYDDVQPACPWEEVGGVRNAGLFRSFGERVTDQIRGWQVNPMVEGLWPDVIERCQRGERLVEAFVAARARVESRWGWGTLELPTSLLCRTEAFGWFVTNLLAGLPALHTRYNEAVRAYRRVNHVRNERHPVPELGTHDGGWLEAPFWSWKSGSNRRARLFARRDGSTILLRDESGSLPSIKLPDNGDACCASREIAGWHARGLRIRPRALTMTMFARVFLADLFIHGIGGAKYDEITDRLIARHYQIPVPGYLTLTSTEHLPLNSWPAIASDVSRARQQLREVEFNPDRFLGEADLQGPQRTDLLRLVEEKRTLCREQLMSDETPSGRKSGAERGRFQRFQAINAELATFVTSARKTAQMELESLQAEVRANRVLANREYAWMLFPEASLREAMQKAVAPLTSVT